MGTRRERKRRGEGEGRNEVREAVQFSKRSDDSAVDSAIKKLQQPVPVVFEKVYPTVRSSEAVQGRCIDVFLKFKKKCVR